MNEKNCTSRMLKNRVAPSHPQDEGAISILRQFVGAQHPLSLTRIFSYKYIFNGGIVRDPVRLSALLLRIFHQEPPFLCANDD
jgi:hypothetical protein